MLHPNQLDASRPPDPLNPDPLTLAATTEHISRCLSCGGNVTRLRDAAPGPATSGQHHPCPMACPPHSTPAVLSLSAPAPGHTDPKVTAGPEPRCEGASVDAVSTFHCVVAGSPPRACVRPEPYRAELTSGAQHSGSPLALPAACPLHGDPTGGAEALGQKFQSPHGRSLRSKGEFHAASRVPGNQEHRAFLPHWEGRPPQAQLSPPQSGNSGLSLEGVCDGSLCPGATLTKPHSLCA